MKWWLLLSMIFSAGAQAPYVAKKYYSSFEGYDHPVTMMHELDNEVVESGKRSYYLAEYNKYDQLTQVTKIYKDKQIYQYRYVYYESGKIEQAKIFRRTKLINTISYDD